MPNAYGALATGATPPPSLGYGQRAEAPIDAVNQWMRAQPWYRQLLTSFGQDPSNVHLSDDQKQQVIRAAQANGVVVDEGHNGQEVDDSGNFQAKSHALKDTLMVAGIAGAALLTAGVAGVFGGAAATGADAAAAGAEGVAETSSVAGLTGTAAATFGDDAALAAAGGAGAAGAGAVAPLVKTVASGAPSWLGPVLGTGISTAGGLIGAKMSADANTEAAQLNKQYLDEALAYQKQKDAYAQNTEANRYGQMMASEQPAISTGGAAGAKMADVLGLPAPQTRAFTPVDPYTPMPAGPAAPATAAPAMVTMRAPDGSTQQVPANQVAHYTQRGAQQVSA